MISLPLSSALSRAWSLPLTESAGDADALAYINALVTAGATVTAGQRAAIDAFVTGEKAGSRWASHKRLYLPIWGIAAPNAICMKSLNSGTFVGGVTPGAGYIQGDGTSGYFDFGVSPSTLGMGPSSEMVGALVYSAGIASSRYICAQSAASAVDIAVYSGGGGAVGVDRIAHANINSTIVATGILSVSRTSTTQFFSHHRRAGVATTIFGATTVASGSITHNILAAARNNSGAISQYSTATLGAYYAGLGISSASADSFTLNLKTLWETCTGLTLP